MSEPSSWFSSLSSCCGFREKRPASRASSAGRNIVVLRDQPVVIPQPSAEPVWSSERTYEKTLERERERERQRARLRRTTSRDSSSVRKRWFSASSSPASVRRFEISGPTNFRHLQSESFQFPPPPSRPRPRSFRPIELSIYQPDNRLSAILPYIECHVTPPPRAYTANSSRWDASSGTTLNHERSYSTMSFHVPRKHARQGSGLSDASMSPPRIPPKSRARAYTAPSTDRIVERIASALIEKDRLQAEINSVIERQSIYVSSRPSTAYDMRDFEPMPSIPAMPAAAPSFAERLSVDGRPHTAPSHMAGIHAANPAQQNPTELTTTPPQPPYPAAIRYESISGSTTMHSSPEQHQQEHLDRPLAPPLPLVLRPPLRKKKSFSRVSHWLFHPDDFDAAHHHGMSGMMMMGMATTSPRPVKESDGFYQCVAPPEGLPRTSMETSSSVYTWETRGKEHNEDGMREGSDEDEDGSEDDDDDEAQTVPTTTAAWTSSPEQTPKVGSSRHTTPVIGFGLGMGGRGVMSEYEKETGVEVAGLGVPSAELDGHRPLSVGVAF